MGRNGYANIIWRDQNGGFPLAESPWTTRGGPAIKYDEGSPRPAMTSNCINAITYPLRGAQNGGLGKDPVTYVHLINVLLQITLDC